MLKLAPFLEIVGGIKKNISSWYFRIFRKTVLKIKLEDGTKKLLSRRY